VDALELLAHLLRTGAGRPRQAGRGKPKPVDNGNREAPRAAKRARRASQGGEVLSTAGPSSVATEAAPPAEWHERLRAVEAELAVLKAELYGNTEEVLGLLNADGNDMVRRSRRQAGIDAGDEAAEVPLDYEGMGGTTTDDPITLFALFVDSCRPE
jgi:hypothetical protein